MQDHSWPTSQLCLLSQKQCPCLEPVADIRKWKGLFHCCVCVYIYTVLSVNEYTPFEKYNFKQYLNEHKKHFQNVDKTKFNITSV